MSARSSRPLASKRALVAALIGVAAMSAGCSSPAGMRLDSMGIPTNRAITRLELSTHPEAELRYPGSTLVKVVGADEVKTRDSEPDPAYVGGILTTTATSVQLYAWYAQWLTARGYNQVTYYRMSDQTSGVAWRAPGGREQVQIGIFDPAQLASQQHISVAAGAGTLVYEEVFVGYRVNTR
jgi:hypothetical protein